ncbi:conjugal transfer protein [Kitasatospora sp. NPDC059646]|uniref:conjugal transfer protein n=1 Tax=Kitasatospora sp. NPDC059646 TaxID=3346893 RepID=UPI0036838B44
MPPQQSVPTGPGGLWEEAGRELARSQPAAAAPSVPASAAAVPWTPHTERSGVRFLQRAGRTLLWGVVGIAAVTGVRAWFIPPKVHIPQQQGATNTGPVYPTAEAQATAAMFARTYLSWDAADRQSRAAALAALLPTGTDTAMGWDGHGRQDVLAVEAAGVTVGEQGQARVRVLALIRPAAAPTTGAAVPATPAPGATAAAPSAQWVALEVPVGQSAGRIVVTGEPGLVGVPARGPAPSQAPVTPTDTEMATTTHPIVETFLRAYATGAATAPTTTSATAPGASIPPLPAGFGFGNLSSWTVDTATGDTRTGTARVSWTVSGASIEQTYRVELTRVSSAQAQTWQVAAIHGGSL